MRVDFFLVLGIAQAVHHVPISATFLSFLFRGFISQLYLITNGIQSENINLIWMNFDDPKALLTCEYALISHLFSNSQIKVLKLKWIISTCPTF